jgi:MFS family permease
MPQSPYRWVVVAAGGFMGCIAMGALFALPVLLTPMVEQTGWSRTGISAAMTIGFLLMAGMSVVWGALSDRFGARPWLPPARRFLPQVSGLLRWHPIFSPSSLPSA